VKNNGNRVDTSEDLATKFRSNAQVESTVNNSGEFLGPFTAQNFVTQIEI